MIKVLHTADLHVGWENYSHFTEQGISSCLKAFRDTLDEIVEIARDEGVDLVAIPGDLYKMRDPNQTYQYIVADFITSVAQDSMIPVVIVPGNHDLPGNPSKVSTTSIFTILDAKNVHIIEDADVRRIETKSGPIKVAAIPWLRACDCGGEDIAATYERVIDDLAKDADRYSYGGAPAILLGHLTVADAKPGSEAGMMLGKDPIIPVKSLARAPFDAVMLGHIHNGQIFSGQHPAVAYCGSPQALDFTDEGDQKHVLIWQVERGETTVRRVHLKSTRKFLTIEREVDGMFTTPDNLAQGEALPDAKGAIARVNITVPKHLAGQIDNAKIHEALKDAAWVQINKRVIQDNAPVKDLATLASMTPIQALEKYCDSKVLTPGFKGEVMAAAVDVMKGA